jgi:hypothetical protein
MTEMNLFTGEPFVRPVPMKNLDVPKVYVSRNRETESAWMCDHAAPQYLSDEADTDDTITVCEPCMDRIDAGAEVIKLDENGRRCGSWAVRRGGLKPSKEVAA